MICALLNSCRRLIHASKSKNLFKILNIVTKCKSFPLIESCSRFCGFKTDWLASLIYHRDRLMNHCALSRGRQFVHVQSGHDCVCLTWRLIVFLENKRWKRKKMATLGWVIFFRVIHISEESWDKKGKMYSTKLLLSE